MKTTKKSLHYTDKKAPAVKHRLSFLVGVLVLFLHSQNAFAAYLITDLDNINLWDYTWSTSGLGNLDITATADFCIESVTGGGAAVPFVLSINDDETPGTLQITNTTTADNLPVTFSVTSNGTNFDLVNPATEYGQYPGSTTAISPGCANSTMTANIISGGNYPDPGIYTGNFTLSSRHIFQFWIFQFTVGNDSLSFNLRIEDLVRISGLEDLVLDTSVITGDITATTPICLFRNGNNSSVSLDVYSSSAPSVGNTFSLTGASDSIPYTLELADGSGTLITSTTTAGNLSNTLSGSAVKNCGGTANYEATIRVSDGFWVGKPEDTYQDTITLSVTAN